MTKTLLLEQLKFPIGHFNCPKNISPELISGWINEIELFPARIKILTENLTVEQLNWKYRPDGWSIKQVVHHCSDSHMNSFIRFKLTLTEELPIIKPYEESKWAELPDGIDDDISASYSIIKSVHYKWCLLLKTLNQNQLSKQFIHPENNKTFSLDEVIGLYAWHCNHHLAHIKQAIDYQNSFNL